MKMNPLLEALAVGARAFVDVLQRSRARLNGDLPITWYAVESDRMDDFLKEVPRAVTPELFISFLEEEHPDYVAGVRRQHEDFASRHPGMLVYVTADR